MPKRRLYQREAKVILVIAPPEPPDWGMFSPIPQPAVRRGRARLKAQVHDTSVTADFNVIVESALSFEGGTDATILARVGVEPTLIIRGIGSSPDMADILYVQNDNDIFLEGLRTSEDETVYVNNATCTVSLINDETGVEVVSDLAMDYVSGSDGNYRATVDASTVVLHTDVTYTAVIVSSSHDLRWVKEFVARDRVA